MTDQLKLSAPWLTHARKLWSLFRNDPDVRVEYDDEATLVRLYVENGAKADALARLLPTAKQFGNVTLGIEVVPANDDVTKIELFRRAFEGNPAVAEVASQPGPFGIPDDRVSFKAEIVQFFNDDISSAQGLYTGTYEQIAKDVFESYEGVYFSTVAKDVVTVWP